MKQLIFIFLASLFTLSSQAQKKVNVWLLDNNRGLIYQRNHIEPFSGIATEEYTQGKKKRYVAIKAGKVDGKTTEWHRNGKKSSEINYKAGKREGKEKQWYQSGQKKLQINYVNDLSEGLYTQWHPNGQKMSEGNFSNGKEQGSHIWWFKTGDKDQAIPYENGIVQGIVKNWYKSGKTKMTAIYNQGEKNGLTQEWYENGELSFKGNFENNKEEGLHESWHENGQLMSKKPFINGQLNEKVIEWASNGQKLSEITYENGKENGKGTWWAKDGQLLLIKHFQQGELLKKEVYKSARMRSKKGFVQVFNKFDANFTVQIKGERIRPIDAGENTYIVDGKVLQLLSVSTKDDLAVFQQSEIKKLEKDLNKSLVVKQETGQTANKRTYLYWSFDVPNEPNTKQQRIKSQHYLAIACQNRILLLNSVLTENLDAKAIKQLLVNTANTIKLYQKPIELGALADKLLN